MSAKPYKNYEEEPIIEEKKLQEEQAPRQQVPEAPVQEPLQERKAYNAADGSVYSDTYDEPWYMDDMWDDDDPWG